MSDKGFYIYEIIHTLAGEIKLLDAHVERLNTAASKIFGLHNHFTCNQLAEQIEALLREKRAPLGVSVHIRVELYESGEPSLRIEEISIYRGYSLRCVEPSATIIPMEIVYMEHSTSASEHISHLERITANQLGADIALRCNSHAEIISANNYPILGVKGGNIYTSMTGVRSAEMQMLLSIASNYFKIFNHNINNSELSSYDELLYIDHHGVTSIKRIGNRIYMNAVATALAKLIATHS
ncbi:MAG: aminotransferase class IV [Rikenellaceae bacterium]